MSTIFTLENIQDFSEKINIDELYEKKKQYDLNKLALFNKILNRIHVRIKTTSRQRKDEPFCWFVVPEIILGVPKYDQAACIAYVLDKLKTNGFAVRYIHPNTLFISWQHWIPSYVRTELKKKTGIVIDEYGNRVQETDEPKLLDYGAESLDTMTLSLGTEKNATKAGSASQKKYTPIDSYKPSGNLIYNRSLLNKIEDKL